MSDKKLNAAAGLAANYQELMAIKDPAALYAKAMVVINFCHEVGITPPRKFAKFKWEISQIKDDLVKMQMYVSNFILRAEGNGVINR